MRNTSIESAKNSSSFASTESAAKKNISLNGRYSSMEEFVEKLSTEMLFNTLSIKIKHTKTVMKKMLFGSLGTSTKFACAIVCAAMMSLTTSNTLGAQNVKREGKVYVEQKKSSEAKSEEKTGFTYKNAEGVSFDIYIGKTGSCYINKVSKSGNKYRKYLGEEISREICQSLGRKYSPKSNSPKSK